MNDANDAIIYIAGYVERKILDSLKCKICYNLFNDCEEIMSTFITRKSFGFLRYPRKDTYICYGSKRCRKSF